MTKYISRAAIAAAALAFGVSGANAYNNVANGANLSVTATVINTCSVTGGILAFGNIATTNPYSQNASTTISVNCPTGFTVAMSTAGSYSATNSRWYVSDNASHSIGYTLSDAAGDSFSSPQQFAGSASEQSITVNGTLDQLSGQPAGSYSDTVQILVNY